MNTTDKKTGIELIAQERKEQIEKHSRTVEDDVKFNRYNQLTNAARMLIIDENGGVINQMKEDIFIPKGWDKYIWHKMLDKSYKERLVIAGALIAAEIDRLIEIDKPFEVPDWDS